MSTKPKKNRYYCKACGLMVLYASEKQWKKSYCASTGKNVRIYLVKRIKDAVGIE